MFKGFLGKLILGIGKRVIKLMVKFIVKKVGKVVVFILVGVGGVILVKKKKKELLLL